ncbi:hypothetical protein [Ureibacillus chungkukjangi]|uniref:Flagellin-like protein n=1 Tax=Ureibacillus chungkukjangi TaxID=1202712 RepID=A0A318TUU2_9BACL|nr:hypothetical protein [Ureibacillus chungkukjangi]MCM3389765.1 hypothetical protein [Ureibacillus chungkukjangi]PYF07640.1 hypothetical protein BJ095_104148 [Ureibacillus chungkukjangi]
MREKMQSLFLNLLVPVKNEKGAQSLEWLGLAALLILVLGIISTAVSNQEGSITTLIGNIIQKISGMVG